ncbi:hypothetical protein JQ594_28460 [Bradyrhizobium manausense]|uniref:hypothetical protein n=1 Tax=Bradyrhizobium manausense TaxID=989370 RepID=UPI001BADF157|nr:hypothetical protein [Bradyrhizobium manausense]MBR0689875.1 hypothetical protein [Bradyrhizobium manausense]
MKTFATDVAIQFPSDRPPGFLLEPFRWAIPTITTMLRDQPRYLSDLIHLSQTRMHLIGVALAHLDIDLDPRLAEILFRGPAEAVLEASIGHQPTGLKRAVRVMPNFMIEAESYRALVRLLGEPQAARLLYHTFEIRDSTIRAMNNVPVPLRAALFSLHENIGDMSSFAEGLRCVALRTGRLTFDQLVTELARARQPHQLLARLKSIVDTLPLPDALPPPQVQYAKRIDSGRQLRQLAKKWGNCLGSYIWNVEHGQCAIYVWRHAGLEAACSVTRCGRLGWFLDEVKGPENSELEPQDIERIQAAFKCAGIFPEAVVGSVALLVANDGLPWRPRRRRRIRPPAPAAQITLPDLACAVLANPSAPP